MLRASGGALPEGEETTRPPTRMWPSDGCTKPAISRSVVVLPQPEGPSRHTRVPFSIARSTSLTTVALP